MKTNFMYTYGNESDCTFFKTKKKAKEHRKENFGSLYASEAEMDRLIPIRKVAASANDLGQAVMLLIEKALENRKKEFENERVMWTYGQGQIYVEPGYFNTKEEAIADRRKHNVGKWSEKDLNIVKPIRKVFFVNSKDSDIIKVIEDALLKSITSITKENGVGNEYNIEDLGLRLWVEKETSPFGISYGFVSYSNLQVIRNESSWWCTEEDFRIENIVKRVAQTIYNEDITKNVN